MSDKNIKVIRGQVRQAVKELMPEVMSAELKTAAYKEISEELGRRLEFINTQVLTQLELMDQRSKDMQNFVTREILASVQVAANNKITETKSE